MSELPANWDKLRLEVLERDHWKCVWDLHDGRLCGEPATDVDHVDDRLDHSKANLRSLCGHHHRIRTSRQGHAAKAAKRRAAKLPPDEHPGWL